MGPILGALGSLGHLFWELWGSLGLHFGGSGGALGSILGVLGVQWVALGVLGAPLGRPRRPKLNFPNFFPPIWGSFLVHFGGEKRSKIRCIF